MVSKSRCKFALAAILSGCLSGCSAGPGTRSNAPTNTNISEYPEATSYETPVLQITIAEGSTRDNVQLLVKKRFENFEGLKQVTLQQYYTPATGMEVGSEETVRHEDGATTTLDFKTGLVALETGAQTVMVQVQKKEMVFDKDGRPLAPRRYYVEEPREQLYVILLDRVGGDKFKLTSEIINQQ